LTTCGRNWLELESSVEYTIVEGDYNELNLRWIVMSNTSGVVWGAFSTMVDAILYVLASMHPGKLIDPRFVW
jgi:hypothetical protein